MIENHLGSIPNAQSSEKQFLTLRFFPFIYVFNASDSIYQTR